MQTLRKIFFYIFTAVYVVVCPLTILYAFGYIFRPGADESIIKTGLIYLSTAPSGAAVYLNGKKDDSRTPVTIQELKPGKYSLKAEMEGFKPWGKDVPVEAEKATVLDKVLLTPEEWKSAKVMSGNFDNILPLQGGDFFLFTKGPLLGDIRGFNCLKAESRRLAEQSSPFAEFKVTSIFSTAGSNSALFVCGTPKETRFMWLGLEKATNQPNDITALFPEAPGEVKWVPGGDPQVFSLQDGYLNRIDIPNGALYPHFSDNVKGYGLLKNEVYVLSEDNTFLKMDYDKSGSSVVLAGSGDIGAAFGEKGHFEIKVLSEEYMLFIGEKGELFANRLPYKFVENGVKGVKIYFQNQWVLVWQSDRVGILDFSVEKTGDVAFEKAPRVVWIYEGGHDIEQCFWAYEASHVLFRDGDEVFLLEVADYGEPLIDQVLEVKKDSAIYYHEKTGRMYFLSASGGDLRALQIIPEKNVTVTPPEEDIIGGKVKGK